MRVRKKNRADDERKTEYKPRWRHPVRSVSHRNWCNRQHTAKAEAQVQNLQLSFIFVATKTGLLMMKGGLLMLQMLGWAFKVFGFSLGWVCIMAAFTNGMETARKIMQTLRMGVQTICMMLQQKMWTKLKGGLANDPVIEDKDGTVK